MKLTLKELQKSMQEQIDTMNTQLQKSKREDDRVDSLLLNLDAFKKETAFNFREMREEFRSELNALNTDVAVLRADVADLRTDVTDLRAELREWRQETRATYTVIMGYVEKVEANHHDRIAALEANKSR